MATLPDSTTSSEMGESLPGNYSVRRLWQIPVFFTGVVALVAVCVSRPLLPDRDRVVHHDLSLARELLQDPGGDVLKAAQLAERAIELSEQFPERRAEAELLLGTAHLRLADQAPADLARDHWRQSRQHLEEAQRLGVAVEDRNRLAYRLGKVAFYTREDPERVLKLLQQGIDQADDLADGYHLLMQTYLRLNPPDLKNAWQANEKLRQVPRLDEDVLGPAKLMGARLLVRMHRQDEARKTLEKIGPKAPPEVLAEARKLLGELYQEDGKWAEAAEVWATLLADRRNPVPQPGRMLYDLGLCRRHLNQLVQAAESWEQCMRRGQPEEAAAAALSLAELRLHERNPETALEAMSRAVARINKPAEWTNRLIELGRARELFEQAAQAFQSAGRLDLVVQLSELYEHLAEPGRARKMRAEATAAWARLKQKQSQEIADDNLRSQEEKAARELFCQAAACYGELVKKTSTAADPDEDLWSCALCYMDGQDYQHASEKLEMFLQRDEVPARLGEGWYRLGEAYRQLKNEDAAGTAYRECLKFGPPFANRARYQLALVSIQKGDLDEAEAALERNLKLLYFDRDPVAREKSLFALGELLYMRKNYRKVVLRLEEALAAPAPTTPAATRARFQLADSYRMLAEQEKQTEWLGRDNLSAEARLHFQKEHQRWLKRACEELQELAAFLKKPESRGHLTREQEIKVSFMAARCRYNLGEYEAALKMYEELAREHRNQPQYLEAMGGTISCYVGINDVKRVPEMRRILDNIRKAIPSIEGLNAAQQKQWLEWAETASKGLPSDDGSEISPPAAGGPEEKTPAILSQPDRNPPAPSVGTLSPTPSPPGEPETPAVSPSGLPSVVVPQPARRAEEGEER